MKEEWICVLSCLPFYALFCPIETNPLLEEITTSDKCPWGLSFSVYGLVWCCCCRILAGIVFPKAPRRLTGLPRVLFFVATPLGLKVCHCSCYNPLFSSCHFTHAEQVTQLSPPLVTDRQQQWVLGCLLAWGSPASWQSPSESSLCLRSKTCSSSSSKFCLCWCNGVCARDQNSAMQRAAGSESASL